MATGRNIFKKMHEYEEKVLTALGFKRDDPVVLREVSREDEQVCFKWYGPGDPPEVLTRGGYLNMEAVMSDGVSYWLHAGHLAPGVWDAIMEARAEWEANFPRIHP